MASNGVDWKRKGDEGRWRGTEEADRDATRRPWVWERLTWTILTLVGVVGIGLLGWTMMGGAPMSDARSALAALLVYVTLCALIVGVDRTIKGQERAERAERRRRLRQPPYSVVDEAEAVLARARDRRRTEQVE